MWIKRSVLLAAVLLVGTFAAHGEDIDLFEGIQTDGSKPNLLFLFDNSGNSNSDATFSCTSLAVPDTSKSFGFEQCALYTAVQQVGAAYVDTNHNGVRDAGEPDNPLLGNINMGLMYLPPNGGGDPYTGAGITKDGGRIIYPATPTDPLPTMDSAGVASFSAKLAGLSLSKDSGSSANVGQMMQEAWAYYSGHVGVSQKDYMSAHFSSACQRNFVVTIMNATVSGGVGPTWPAVTSLTSAGATDTSQIDLGLKSNSYYKQYAAEWARFMYGTDMSSSFDGKQNITTYTIIVTDGKNDDYVALLKGMAAYGGGKSFVVANNNLAAMVQALLQIFNEVQAVNSAFSSASLPVSANAQGQYLNQVFMGVFRPDLAPRWQGNLKQYKLGPGATPTDTILVDSNGKDAITGASTGFLSPNAVSYWTSVDTTKLPDSAGGFWVNNPQGAAGGYDFKAPGSRTPGSEDPGDGEIVEKGGVHQRIRLAYQKVDYASSAEVSTTFPLSSTVRQLYTCTSGCVSGSNLKSTPFSVGNSSITDTLLGAAGSTVTVSSIKRQDVVTKGVSSSVVTVTLASAPSPALSAGQTVTVTGSNNGIYNGAHTIDTTDGSTYFTFSMADSALAPPASPTGSYTISLPVITDTGTVSLLNSTTAQVITATRPASDFATYPSVTIFGAAPTTVYSKSAAITVTGTNTFTYGVNLTPAIGSGAKANTMTPTTAEINVSGSNLIVTLTGAANSTSGFGTTVTVSGLDPSVYNVTNKTILYAGSTAASCLGSSAKKNASVCYSVPLSSLNPTTTTVALSTVASSAPTISSLTRASTSCTGADSLSDSATRSVATATGSVQVPTSSDPFGVSSFPTTLTADIGGTPKANEGAYIVTGAKVAFTSGKTTGANRTYTFTYPVTVSPPCTEQTSGTPGIQAAVSGGDKTTLIRWVRGEDNAGDEASPQAAPHPDINIRPSIHGDVLHSRPVIINYGGSIGVVAFYGSNDGVFRAVNGNQANPDGSSMPAPGNELWGFIPQEFFSKLARLRNNSPLIKLSNTSAALTPAPLAKDYFFDGSTGVYRDAASGSVYLYLSARRGGRLIYAIDVTDPMTPKFMWKHTNADTGFAELGQTWSQPKAVKVKGYSNPVLIFGAGYDGSEDAQPASSVRSMGRGIFILDAITGGIVWKAQGGAGSDHCSGNPCTLASMTYAVPSDVTVLDRNFDGFVDRIYVGDVGGHMWRVDLEPPSRATPPVAPAPVTPEYWEATLLADVGGSGSEKRKIFFAPSVVAAPTYDAVLFSTGDREHPVYGDSARSIANRFYMIKDNPGNDGSKNADGTSRLSAVTDSTSSTAFDTVTGMFDVTPITVVAPSGGVTTTSVPYDGTGGGFYLNLTGLDGGVTHSGEKGVNAAVTVGGWTYFATNTPEAPSTSSCQANLGVARAYKVNFFTGASSSTVIPGGGLAPTAVVATVTLDNGETRQVCIGCGDGGQSAKSFEGAGNTGSLPSPKRERSFWYEKR